MLRGSGSKLSAPRPPTPSNRNAPSQKAEAVAVGNGEYGALEAAASVHGGLVLAAPFCIVSSLEAAAAGVEPAAGEAE